MPDTLTKIHNILIKKHKTVAAAESCTGGLLSKLLTDLPGSSKYFTLGLVTYSNTAKKEVLKVPIKILSKKGAVSKEAAEKMSLSAKNLGRTDFGIGITGIAGPGGGNSRKPKGTVFIAIAVKNKAISERFSFKGSRAAIRRKAALKALQLLYENIYRY